MKSKKWQQHRKYSSGISDGSFPMNEPLPSMGPPSFMKASNQMHSTQVTTLDNGLRIASENRFGHFCTIGVLVDSGSRYEVNYPSGISHFLEKLAFSKTTSFANRDEMLQIFAKYGGIFDCQSYRDTMIYAASLESSGLADGLDILSDVVLRPVFNKEEIECAQEAIAFDIKKMNEDPNPDMLLMEFLHKAAYRDNTLGLPKVCPEENVTKITSKDIYTFMKNIHLPKRTVVAGVGIEHERLVDLVQEYFVQKKSPIWEENADLVDPSKQSDHSISQYTGGQVLVERDLSNVSLGHNPMPELAHFVIGLESSSYNDDDFVAFCVLNMIMGGGGSFSAGGPGKGMFTRLYTNVLNRYHWIHCATAINNAYEDSGVFYIHGSADPKQLGSLSEVILGELINTSRSIREDELDRGKIQLQSMMLMNLENRPVVFEDIGRQILNKGLRMQPEYYFDEIGKITMDDVHRVVNRMVKSKPAVVGYGTLKKLPSYDQIQSSLVSPQKGVGKKLFNLF